MDKYATTQSFGNQRASIGRMVMVRVRTLLMPGIIVEIRGDAPVIQVLDGSSIREALVFFNAATELDLERMPSPSWCWPPRV